MKSLLKNISLYDIAYSLGIALFVVSAMVLLSSCASFPSMATVSGPQDRARTHRYIETVDSTGYHRHSLSDVLLKDNCLDSVMVELDNRYVKRW